MRWLHGGGRATRELRRQLRAAANAPRVTDRPVRWAEVSQKYENRDMKLSVARTSWLRKREDEAERCIDRRPRGVAPPPNVDAAGDGFLTTDPRTGDAKAAAAEQRARSKISRSLFGGGGPGGDPVYSTDTEQEVRDEFKQALDDIAGTERGLEGSAKDKFVDAEIMKMEARVLKAAARKEARRSLWDVTHPEPSMFMFNGKLVPPPPQLTDIIVPSAMRLGEEVYRNQQFELVYQGGPNDVYLDTGPNAASEIAFLGMEGAGKSSLVNAILEQDVARTGSRPGTTRTVNFYQCPDPELWKDAWADGPTKYPMATRLSKTHWGGALVDLPGVPVNELRPWAKDTFTQCLNQYYDGMRRQLRATFYCIDATRGVTIADLKWLRKIPHLHPKPVLTTVVITKADLVSHGRLCGVMHALYKLVSESKRKYGMKVSMPIVPTSSVYGWGIPELRAHLVQKAEILPWWKRVEEQRGMLDRMKQANRDEQDRRVMARSVMAEKMKLLAEWDRDVELAINATQHGDAEQIEEGERALVRLDRQQETKLGMFVAGMGAQFNPLVKNPYLHAMSPGGGTTLGPGLVPKSLDDYIAGLKPVNPAHVEAANAMLQEAADEAVQHPSPETKYRTAFYRRQLGENTDARRGVAGFSPTFASEPDMKAEDWDGLPADAFEKALRREGETLSEKMQYGFTLDDVRASAASDADQPAPEVHPDADQPADAGRPADAGQPADAGRPADALGWDWQTAPYSHSVQPVADGAAAIEAIDVEAYEQPAADAAASPSAADSRSTPPAASPAPRRPPVLPSWAALEAPPGWEAVDDEPPVDWRGLQPADLYALRRDRSPVESAATVPSESAATPRKSALRFLDKLSLPDVAPVGGSVAVVAEIGDEPEFVGFEPDTGGGGDEELHAVAAQAIAMAREQAQPQEEAAEATAPPIGELGLDVEAPRLMGAPEADTVDDTLDGVASAGIGADAGRGAGEGSRKPQTRWTAFMERLKEVPADVLAAAQPVQDKEQVYSKYWSEPDKYGNSRRLDDGLGPNNEPTLLTKERVEREVYKKQQGPHYMGFPWMNSDQLPSALQAAGSREAQKFMSQAYKRQLYLQRSAYLGGAYGPVVAKGPCQRALERHKKEFVEFTEMKEASEKAKVKKPEVFAEQFNRTEDGTRLKRLVDGKAWGPLVSAPDAEIGVSQGLSPDKQRYLAMRRTAAGQIDEEVLHLVNPSAARRLRWLNSSSFADKKSLARHELHGSRNKKLMHDERGVPLRFVPGSSEDHGGYQNIVRPRKGKQFHLHRPLRSVIGISDVEAGARTSIDAMQSAEAAKRATVRKPKGR